MPTYHRSQRLRLVGTGPKVEQLQEGRFRLTFTCTATNPNEAWMNGNKDQIMTAYGTLQSAQKNIAGIDPRTDEAYSDMVLFRTEANPSERDLIITLVYETATETFVKSQDDKVDFELNGLKRVTRVTIAKTETALPTATVGSTTLSESETDLILASKSVEENDAFIQITEVYLEQGTVSESIDNVGSQLAKVITTFGADPGTPTDYVLASKEESNFAGYQTNTFRFLKPSIISVEESKNTPENRITVRVFNLASDHDSVSAASGAVVDTDTHILVSQSDQDHAGIKTSVYVFESKDYNTKSTNEFGRTVIDRVEQSASDFALQSQSSTYTVDSVADLRILSQTIENNDNNVNKRTTRFTTVGIDDIKEDIVGSQKAIIITKVGAEPTTGEAAYQSDIGYDSVDDWSIARKDNAREGGLDVYTYTFLLNNTILSETEDRKGSLKTNAIEVFNPNVTIPGIRVDGGDNISGEYFLSSTLVFGKNMYTKVGNFYNMQIMYSTSNSRWEFNTAGTIYAHNSDTNPENSLDPPNTEWTTTIAGGFGEDANEVHDLDFTEFDTTLPSSGQGLDTSHRYDKDGYSLISLQKSAVDGIPTMRYTFAKDNSVISVSEDKLGSQNAIVNEIFNPTSETITGVDSDNNNLSGYTEVDRTESDYEGIKTIRVRFLQDNVSLSRSIDESRADKPEVIEYFKPSASRLEAYDADTNPGGIPDGKILDAKAESNVDGIPTERYTFRKDGAVLSQNWDKIGSQQAVVITKYNSDPVSADVESFTGDSGLTYVIARKVKNGRERTFTFMETDSVLSKTVDNESPLLTEVIEYFKPASTRLDDYDEDTNPGGIPSGFVLTNKTESNVDGIPTERYTFKKSDVILSRSYELVGSQEAVVISKFGSAPTTSEANAFGGANYTIAKKEISGTTNQFTFTYTFLQSNVVLSVSEDKLGSQKAIVNEIFNPTDTDTETDGLQITGKDAENANLDDTYSEVDRTISDFEGIKTVRVRFLKSGVTLLKTEDQVGSTLAIVEEVFDGTPDTPTDYSIAKEEESNVDGVSTKRYTFLKDDALLSSVEDFESSLDTITEEWFNPAYDDSEPPVNLRRSKTSYVLIRESKSDIDGIPTERYTFAKPCIISVAQDFVEDINTIQVTAFSKTEASVKASLSEVIPYNQNSPTANHHKLISQRENNHDGIKTTTYTFEINTSDIIQFTADDRLQVTRTIYAAHDFNYDSNYTVGTSTATVNNTSLTLTSLRVDQRGTSGSFTKLTAVYTQPKIVTVSPIMTSQYNDVPVYQYRSIVSSANAINDVLVAADPSSRIDDPNGTDLQANAVFFEPSINNNTSPSTFTQNVLNTSTNLSVANSSVLISSHDDLYNFLYPGVVRLDSRFFGRKDDEDGFNRIDIKTTKESYPITTKVRCNVYNFIQRSNDIADTDFTYDGASGLWSPNSWATVDANIIKSYNSYTQEPNFTSNVYTGYRINGSSIRGELVQFYYGVGTNYQNPTLFYNGVNYGFDSSGYSYEIKITQPGPPDPIGRKWCLGVDIQPAFRDSNGNTYYNKQIIVTERIPTLKRGQVTYS